ncbi:MAG: hypothetical protein MPW15_01940 [Candidatus Manganitrophus sp.]|nr:hypothetical protein [Candidatus Manganitrophus sp.]
MGATPGMTGTARAQLALRQAFLFTETYAVLQPEVLVARAHEKIDGQGRLKDEATRNFIRELLEALIAWTLPTTPRGGATGSRLTIDCFHAETESDRQKSRDANLPTRLHSIFSWYNCN